MLGMMKYSHLSTKLRVMYGEMLKNDDYDSMVHMHTVKEVADYLKNNTYYREALENMDELNIHRGRLEILLYRAEIADALKIAKYLRGDDKKMFRYVYRRQEIEDIKKMLRHLQMGLSLEEIDRQSLFISWHSVIDFNEALKASNIHELLEAIKNTNFYPILKPLQISNDKIDLFAAEMGLDMYFFEKLKEQLKKTFKGRDKKVAYSLFGMEADIKNILWIYRGKMFYNMNKQLLYRYLIPLKYKLNKEIVDKMVEAKTGEDLVKVVKESYYRMILSDDVKEWENNFKYYLNYHMLKNLRQYPFTLSPVMSYILLKEVEKHNVTSIVEGIRYGIDAEKIQEKLIKIDVERR